MTYDTYALSFLLPAVILLYTGLGMNIYYIVRRLMTPKEIRQIDYEGRQYYIQINRRLERWTEPIMWAGAAIAIFYFAYG